ncbi:MAG: hypothetical protein MUO54_10305, partial [Anaerolineales bacterium]|nr:hypothetical protein [Anaerolineales bacterium]
MNKRYLMFWVLIIAVSLLVGACDSGAGAGAPAAADGPGEEPVPDIRTDPNQEREYLFEMSAD